jgi:hypothetical protein
MITSTFLPRVFGWCRHKCITQFITNFIKFRRNEMVVPLLCRILIMSNSVLVWVLEMYARDELEDDLSIYSPWNTSDIRTWVMYALTRAICFAPLVQLVSPNPCTNITTVTQCNRRFGLGIRPEKAAQKVSRRGFTDRMLRVAGIVPEKRRTWKYISFHGVYWSWAPWSLGRFMLVGCRAIRGGFFSPDPPPMTIPIPLMEHILAEPGTRNNPL